MRHKWKKNWPAYWATMIEECVHCGCTRTLIGQVGIRRIRLLYTYVTPDAIRYTGVAPVCNMSGRLGMGDILLVRQMQESGPGGRIVGADKWFEYWYYPNESEGLRAI